VRAELIPVMTGCRDFFRYDRSGKIPYTYKGFNEIATGVAVPIKTRPYKVPFALNDEMRKLDMLQRGVITPACSEWAAIVILAKKKSLDDTTKYRFCTDFRG
jgi:hypothetical protein